jgi:hypothetical protein
MDYTLEQKHVAMDALLGFIEAEVFLRTKIPTGKSYADLWAAQIDGVRVDKSDPKWKPPPINRITLGPLLAMLAPHQGTNQSLNYLPFYPDQYKLVVDFRNAIGHGDWEELQKLGGPDRALAWAKSFYQLVMECENRPTLYALAMGDNDWPWPT